MSEKALRHQNIFIIFAIRSDSSFKKQFKTLMPLQVFHHYLSKNSLFDTIYFLIVTI